MTDREILEKHINLDDSYLTESEKTQVRDMIYECREAFSLRDEIGTWLNIEIDMSQTKLHFLLDLTMKKKKTREY